MNTESGAGAPRSGRAKKVAMWSLGILLGLVGVLAILVWALTWHPDAVQDEPVTCEGAKPLPADRPLKVLSWNIQFLAGKDYVFFFDILDGSGPDERPSSEAIARTLAEVVRIIVAEQPDLVLLQEVDDGAARTDDADQLALILDALEAAGRGRWCHASAFYWKASFVPHPRIMGSAGMKLSTLSPFAITKATRHQLPLIPSNPVSQQFGLKRATLTTVHPLADGRELSVVNLHLDAFAQGTDTMTRQVDQVVAHLSGLTEPWVAGGDFNLLASAGAYERLGEPQRAYFNPTTELAPLLSTFRVMPSAEDTAGMDAPTWFTHFPNDPATKAPDRTIDYLAVPRSMTVDAYRVRQQDTLAISDHLPVIATIRP